MKYPYTLSELRQSLLSPEDRRLYIYEHSPFYSYDDKIKCVNAYRQRKEYYMTLINDDNEFSDLNESEKIEMSKELTKLEAASIIDEFDSIVYPLINDCLSVQEYNDLKNNIQEQINKFIDSDDYDILNEAGGTPGHDMTYWLHGLNMSWLGKAGFGLLTLGAAGLVGLFMAGKDKMAAKKLEKYMNKLVELTDSGIFKKKSIFSFFGKGKMSGDQSMGCFRNALEIAERTIAKDVLIMGKICGLLGDNGMKDAINGTNTTGGINKFYEGVVVPLGNLQTDTGV